MTDEDFKAKLSALSQSLKESLKTLTPIQVPAADPAFTDIQSGIWERVSGLIESAHSVFPAHCELCREEFNDDIGAATFLINAYITGYFTDPAWVWNVSFRSKDKQRGFSKTFYDEAIPPEEGYEIDAVSKSILFKEERTDIS